MRHTLDDLRTWLANVQDIHEADIAWALDIVHQCAITLQELEWAGAQAFALCLSHEAVIERLEGEIRAVRTLAWESAAIAHNRYETLVLVFRTCLTQTEQERDAALTEIARIERRLNDLRAEVAATWHRYQEMSTELAEAKARIHKEP